MTAPLPRRAPFDLLAGPSAAGAAALYAVIALAMTWPLAAGLARDIPWDLGDSVLNAWILQWGADHWLRFLGGDLGAFRGYFNANIFYPEPLTLAYSEHLTAQVLQILPVYALTGNIVLSYNLLFLSTFVLSGLGAFLLVRELTGSARAGFVAGLLYAFAPYRIGQFSHVQVMSSQWMPFALYGFRRYFETRRPWPLAGAALALVAQNWSCGYFLLYFAPFAAAYVVYEIADRSLWKDVRVWASLGAAAAVVMGATVPLLLPYLELRQHGFGPRPIGEVAHFSADVYSYLTAHEEQSFWGAIMRAFVKPEGELFPSLLPVMLATIGLAAHARVTWAVTRSRGADPDVPAWRRAVLYVAAVVLAWELASVLVILARTGFDWHLGPLSIRVHNTARALRTSALAAAVLLVCSRRARAFARGVPGSAVAFYAAALLAAFWLSLGPIIMSRGVRVAGDGLYWWFYQYVPGFDGLRVPARMAMVFALALAVAGGYGARVIERSFRRSGAVLAAVALLFLVEASPAPIKMNGTWSVGDLKPPPVPLMAAEGPPAIYRAVRALPPRAVLAEFPFGEEQYELRYMLHSASHWRPLLNGYSGGFPRSYAVNRAGLGRVLDDPDTAWRVLAASGATHAIVHEEIYPAGSGARVSAWLLSHGAREVAVFGADRLFELPPPTVARFCPALH
ncbi:MAG: hypothetical protein MUE61_14830 [Vicinamibacterales bacterium]|jgi:hypothetical protein|nr:hypothetical protein [Vicinamibacterales bacterium]